VVLRRRAEQPRTERIGYELAEGLSHLRTAALLAAERTAERIGPAVSTARERMAPSVERAKDAASRSWENAIAAVTPLTMPPDRAGRKSRRDRRARRRGRAIQRQLTSAQAREVTRRARNAARVLRGQEPRRRRWPWVIGALALGAFAGAAGALIGRQRDERWEEYESERRPQDTTQTMRERASQVAGTVRERAAAVAGVVRERASQTAETLRNRGQGHGAYSQQDTRSSGDRASDQTQEVPVPPGIASAPTDPSVSIRPATGNNQDTTGDGRS